ncbi:MAG: hypothetical protein LC731_05775 [Acidobacteria bacterium]|nr:hypothetical protein [Acidobacteriota bacterium]
MSDSKRPESHEGGPLSRRKFFEETAVKGGAALVGTAATACGTLAQANKGAGNCNSIRRTDGYSGLGDTGRD